MSIMSEAHTIILNDIPKIDAENVVLGKHKMGSYEGDELLEPPYKRRAVLGMLTNVPGHRRVANGKLLVNILPKLPIVKWESVAQQPGYFHSGHQEETGAVTLKSINCFPENNQSTHWSANEAVAKELCAVNQLDVCCSEDLSDEEVDELDVIRDEKCKTVNEVINPDHSGKMISAEENQLLSAIHYQKEIHVNLRIAELRHGPSPNYMQKQTDITCDMRRITVDWMVEVCAEYKLHRETLFLSVNYMDRFLSQMSVLRDKLQLVATAAMFIASKYEEVYPPEVKDFASVTDDTYEVDQIIKMEYLMLKVLQFDVCTPTSSCFAEKYLTESGADEKTTELSLYLTELSLLNDDYLQFLPSIIAASAICLANCTLGLEPWSERLEELSEYKISDFELCLRTLHQTLVNASTQKSSVDVKYAKRGFHYVTQLKPVMFLDV